MTIAMAIAEPATLEQVQAFYDAGLYLRAYAASRALGPFKDWNGPSARLLASRLTSRLGADKLSRQLLRLAYREFPTDWSVRYFYAYHLLSRRGPLRAVELLLDCGNFAGAGTEQQAEWLALSGTVHALLRDFDAAQQYLKQALELDPERPWIWVEQSHVLAMMDRREEALAAIERALELRPWYRPAVEGKADILTDRGDDRATEEFLREAAERLEYGHIVARHAAILREMERYDESRDAYERCRQYYPLAEKAVLEWLDATCADAAYYCGDYTAASALAAKVDTPFMKSWGERLSNASPDDRRVQLPVQFVRQHHLTCAPATLAAISQYWGEPADHLELAEKICYDGTPGHSERRWAEERWARVREFAVDWDAARALIDRGIPFTLETRTAVSAHLQAVVGYDSRRGTLLIRDPGQRHTSEFIAEALFKSLASVGPRGMVFVPESRVAALNEVTLPEAELFDRYFALQCALADHRRDDAERVAAQVERDAPGARLTLAARRTLCYYDGDTPGALAITEQLLERYSDDSKLEYERLECLAALRRLAERTERLAALCADKERPAVYWRDYGQELANDARRHDEALRWLNRAAATLGPDGPTYVTLAGIHWEQGRREWALRLYRYAACIEDKWEAYARRYFLAARHLKRQDEVLKFLRRRFDEYGHKSCGPAITLHNALKELDRDVEAGQLLDAALEKRPDDGALLTFAAEQRAWSNRHDEADTLMARASTCAHRGAWLRAAAYLAEARGDVQESLRAWQSLAKLEPLNADAHGKIYDQLRATDGEPAALEYIRAIGAAHPHHVGIQQLLLLKLRGADLAEATAVARRALALHPSDGWTRRELYHLLAMQGQVEEALAEADSAVAAEPNEDVSFSCRAHLFASLGLRERAREDFRQALRLSIDCDSAFDGLLGISESPAERSEALRFIADECRRQTTFGAAPLMLIERGQGTIPADELLAFAREAHAARPDLWQTWCALSIQLGDCQQPDEALRMALEVTERFPLIPRVWLELAHIHRDAGRREEQIAACRRALEVNPGWGQPAQELSDAYAAAGDGDQAREVLEQVVRRAPQDLVTQVYLADLLWKQNRREEAIQILTRVCRLSPGYEWAWNTLRGWLLETGRGEDLLATARASVDVRPGNADGWVRLAETLGATGGTVEEQLAAYDQAISIEPAHLEAHACRVEILADQQRYDEALAACRSPIWGNDPPARLRAWDAEVRGRKGEIAAAIDCFEQILREHPQYTWACYRLNDFLWQAERWADGRQAAERFVEISPDRAMAWGYLGDFAMRVGDRARAKEAFARSCEVEPDYEFGARHLSEMLLDDGDPRRAAAVMEEWSTHAGDTPYTLATKLRISIALHDKQADLKEIAALAALKNEDLDGYREFGKLLGGCLLRRRAARALRRAIRDEATNPLLGATWMAAIGAEWPTVATLCYTRPRTAAWRMAASQFAEHCATHHGGWKVTTLTLLLGNALRGDVDCWGLFGYAFVNLDWHRLGLHWLRDWRQRDGVRPWMICNVAFAEWALGRFVAAAETTQTALAQPPDHTLQRHRAIHGAAQFALDADAEEVMCILTDIDEAKLSPAYLAMRAVALSAAKEIAEPSEDYVKAFHALNGVISMHRERLNRYTGGRKLAYRAMERLALAYGRRLRAKWYRLAQSLGLPY